MALFSFTGLCICGFSICCSEDAAEAGADDIQLAPPPQRQRGQGRGPPLDDALAPAALPAVHVGDMLAASRAV